VTAGRAGVPRVRPGAVPLVALVALVSVAALVTLARAEPAAADPPRPTDYRSTVDAIEPTAEAVDAEVVGGDAFLELTVAPGHEVIVTGYQGEPYLVFRPDGTVERNRRSPATYVNESRDAGAEAPPAADPEAEPDWETVAGDGRYAWHDHRIHWMGADRPEGAEPGEWTRPWVVEIDVDGTPTRITGTLALIDGVNPLPWLALGLATAAAVAVAGRRRPRLAAALATLAAATLATGLGWAQRAEAPAGSGASPLLLAVPAAGLVAGALALSLVALRADRGRGSDGRARGLAGRRVGDALTLAGAAAVVGWAVLRISVLWKPVLPTVLDAGIDRAGTAVAAGLAVAAAGLVLWGSGLPAPSAAADGASTDDGEHRVPRDAKTGTAATVAGGDRR
jgi:hypothetical protein